MRNRWLFVFVTVAIFVSASAQAQVNYRDNDLVVNRIDGPALSVHFLDVGQGDAILVVSPDGETLLVDVGPRKRAVNPLPYLKQAGVTKIDHLMITHSHLDHIGGFQRIAKELPIGEFWWSGYFHPTGTAKKLLAKVEELKIPTRVLKRGDELKLGAEVGITVLHPPETEKAVDHDLNNYSIVLRISYGEIDFLLTGDAEVKAERMILASNMAVESEFLKVGHHGSVTATTLTFLKSVAPSFGVISCGRNNKYDHPHHSTLEHLTDAKVAILRTDDVGTIVVRTDGKKVSINLKGQRGTHLLFLRDATRYLTVIFGRREDDEALQHLDRAGDRVLDHERRFGRAA